jgi:hypothetical protein
MKSGKLFGFCTTLLKHLRFSQETHFAPELRFVFAGPVIIAGLVKTVAAGGLPFHLSSHSERLCSKNELVCLEEEESPDQVCHDRCHKLPHP